MRTILRTVTAGLLALACLAPGPARAVVNLNADQAGGDAYGLINASGYRLETPDCGHPVKHVSEAYDSTLHKIVLVFTIHRDLDDDRCINKDRQRIEMCTNGSSPTNMTGQLGETHTYRWKFKLDAAFQPSADFCHIHQIKADGGSDADAPIVTFTPRAGSPQTFEVMNIADGGRGGTVAHTDLAPFKGAWVEAYEKVKYGDNSAGTYSVTIRRVSDGTVLLSYSDASLDMWRSGSNLNRPKFGIYRSLNDKSALRDESVRFADFCLAEGTDDCPPAPATVTFKLPQSRSAPAGRSRLLARLLDLNGRTLDILALPGLEPPDAEVRAHAAEPLFAAPLP